LGADVSYVVTDEDVQLIAEALVASGWNRMTGKHGFGAKMLALEESDKKLKAILGALIEAKLTEQPVLPDLDPKQALRALQDATAVVPLDIAFQFEQELVEVPGYYHKPAHVVKQQDVVVEIQNMHQYQLQALVNFLRKYTPP
jgi:hypothetical protein